MLFDITEIGDLIGFFNVGKNTHHWAIITEVEKEIKGDILYPAHTENGIHRPLQLGSSIKLIKLKRLDS